MRHVVLVVVMLGLAACNTTPVSQNQPQPASPAPVAASEGEKPSTDSPMEFLLISSASDFHAHRPPTVARFRGVRFGHMMSADGATRYLLCGEFLPQAQQGKAEWTPFVTIKTSGYEQWLGSQAVGFCQGSKVVWDGVEDLSSALQNRLDSLR